MIRADTHNRVSYVISMYWSDKIEFQKLILLPDCIVKWYFSWKRSLVNINKSQKAPVLLKFTKESLKRKFIFSFMLVKHTDDQYSSVTEYCQAQ